MTISRYRAVLAGVCFVLLSSTGSAGGPKDTVSYAHDPSWPTVLDQFQWGVAEDKEATNSTSATGVGVDRQHGLVYVLVRTAPNVRVFREDGTFVRAWSPAKVVNVHMLHVDPDSNIWIADSGAHTVTKYTPEGKVLLTLGTFGEPGMDGKHFNAPTDIATTADGQTLFVSDGYGNNRVAKFDRSGSYLGMWGGAKPGTEPGEFILPHSITVVDQKVYVADRSGGRIQAFDLDGHFIDEWRDTIVPWGIAEYQQRLYVIGVPFKQDSAYPTTTALTQVTITDPYKAMLPPKGQIITVFDRAGGIVQTILLPQGQTFGEVDWVHGVDVGANGDIYLVDVMGNHIQKWNKTVFPENNVPVSTQ
ncbi:6-bladed beta-propeller [Kineobactrum salinum]|uniref:6-bladed beta-propeller n=1 Tax=Kineobactrum salinum TaxID=2708301 RepID=A0A6C0TWF3_9GAMM|nr:6-bladed beta-propeller [Kineobactrum salinum]QIB64106.1 hypothetical protein G3T16_00415 [Kineobactrum salinum]